MGQQKLVRVRSATMAEGVVCFCDSSHVGGCVHERYALGLVGG